MTNKSKHLIFSDYLALIFFVVTIFSCNPSTPPAETNEHQGKKVLTYYKSGQIETQGQVINEVKEGLWISNYENGVRWSENFYKEGKLNGTSLVFYPNGNMRYRGSYRMGEKIGEWIFYTEDGKVDFKTQFEE